MKHNPPDMKIATSLAFFGIVVTIGDVFMYNALWYIAYTPFVLYIVCHWRFLLYRDRSNR